MFIKEGDANTEMVKLELKNYDDKWDWQVKQCDRDIFSLVFPNQMSQQHFTIIKSFDFSSVVVKARIMTSDLPPGASSRLKPTWVKVSGIPKEFREEVIIKHVCKMVGKHEEIDKEALKGKGLDRIKIKCKQPEKINSSFEFFFGTSHFVTFEGEEMSMEESDSPSEKDPSNHDDRNRRGHDKDKDRDKDKNKGGESDGSESPGEFKKTTEQKVVWKELKTQISNQEGRSRD
jgi:hypothetical protein